VTQGFQSIIKSTLLLMTTQSSKWINALLLTFVFTHTESLLLISGNNYSWQSKKAKRAWHVFFTNASKFRAWHWITCTQF